MIGADIILMLAKKIKKVIINKKDRRRAMANTKNKGVIQFLIYREKGVSIYTAVCLTFDIVEHGKDIDELKNSIQEAARLHLESVIENKLDDKLLNRSAPQKYWRILFEALETKDKASNKDQYQQEIPAVSDIWNRSSKELVTA
jgi:predicted RNase H-like HicB family nuclease